MVIVTVDFIMAKSMSLAGYYCYNHTKSVLLLCIAMVVIFHFYCTELSNYYHYDSTPEIPLEIPLSLDTNCPSITANLTLLVFIKPDFKQFTRLKTTLLTSLSWFWPHPNSELIFVTDRTGDLPFFESNLTFIAREILPKNFKWSILFEETLMMNTIHHTRPLNYEGRHKQIPRFWSDNFTNSEFIGIVDADTLFVTPVMASDLFVDGKPVMRGTFGCPSHFIVEYWAKNVRELLNLPFVGNFMDYFPVIVRREDFEKLRNSILKQNNFTNFDQLFDQVKNRYSEFTLIGNYLWHFEHENYYWVMEKSSKKCDAMITVKDERFVQYGKRRLPPVSIHWGKVQKHLNVNMETVLLNGICYADRTLWSDCLKWNIPKGYANTSDISIFYNRANLFEWMFELDCWYNVDSENALRGHQRRMKLLEQCYFHWNYTNVAELLEKY